MEVSCKFLLLYFHFWILTFSPLLFLALSVLDTQNEHIINKKRLPSSSAFVPNASSVKSHCGHPRPITSVYVVNTLAFIPPLFIINGCFGCLKHWCALHVKRLIPKTFSSGALILKVNAPSGSASTAKRLSPLSLLPSLLLTQ